MDWLTDVFQTPDQQRALLSSLLVALITGVVGTWVVIRGLSFIGDAIAHGVLPGIAVAFLAGFPLAIGAAIGAVVMVSGITLVNRRTRLADETGVGLLFVGMLALGVVIASRAGMEAEELGDLLFGDVLDVTWSALLLQGVSAAIALLLTALFYRAFLVMAFNEEKAEVLGLHPRLAHVALLGLIALSVVSSFRAVGTLLVFGLLVAPAATAALVAPRVPAMMATAVAVGSAASVIGLVVAHHARTEGGATIAATAVALFFVVLTAREIGGRRSRAVLVPA